MVKLTKRAQVGLLGLGALGGGLAYYYCYVKKQCPVINKVQIINKSDKECEVKDVAPVKPTEKCDGDGGPPNMLHGYGKPRHHVFLIRHGEYYTYSRKTDPKMRGRLTETGKKQAQLTAARLNEMNTRWQELVCSTQLRAEETAAVIAEKQNLALKHSELITEMNVSNPKHIDRIEKAYEHYFCPPPRDQTEHTYTILVCHANVIRYLVCRVLGCPVESFRRMNLHHGSITWISIRGDGKKQVWTVGEISHMPTEDVTFHNLN